MKAAFIYSDDFSRFSYGSTHPLKPFRLKLTYELIKACGLLAPDDPRVIVPAPAKREDLLAFHTAEYIDMLEASNSGKERPVLRRTGSDTVTTLFSPGCSTGRSWSPARRSWPPTSLTAGKTGSRSTSAVACTTRRQTGASGFCYINDPVLAIMLLVARGRRVAYIDIDAHHGDGVHAAFYDTDKVLTISLHETGQTLFPGTGFEWETGEGTGRGTA